MPEVIKETEQSTVLLWSEEEVERLEDDEVEALRTCLSSNQIRFSSMSGGDIDGHILSVGYNQPGGDPMDTTPLPGNGVTFKTRADVKRFGLSRGYLGQFLYRPQS
jgi:hypothetical protein